MAVLPPIYRAVVIDHQSQLAKLVRSAGVAPVRKLYESMLREVTDKLRVTTSGTFGHQQLQGILAQVRLGLARVQRGLGDAVEDGATQVGIHAARTILQDAAKLEEHFTGAILPIPLLQAGRLAGLVQGRTSSLMRVHETSMARFGAQLTGRIESELAGALSMAETHSQAIDRVMKVGDLEWYRAERIVRTELSYVANSSARDAANEQAEELGGDMWSRWTEHVSDDGMPLDDRVGVDSEAMNGQVAPPGGMFTQPPASPSGEEVSASLIGQQWECPPNRPNDRAVLVPWRSSWGIRGWQWSGGRRVPVTEAIAERHNATWRRDRGIQDRGPYEVRPEIPGRPSEREVEPDDEDDDGEDAPPTGVGFDSPTVTLAPEAPATPKLPPRVAPVEPEPEVIIPTQEEIRDLQDRVTMIDSAALAERGWYERPGLDRAELDRGVGALNAGQPTPVAIGVTPGNHLVVHTGRGHLNAAADLEQPVRVRWEESAGVPKDHVPRGNPHPASGHPDIGSHPSVQLPVPPAHEDAPAIGPRHYRHLRTGIRRTVDQQAADRAVRELSAEQAAERHGGMRIGVHGISAGEGTEAATARVPITARPAHPQSTERLQPPADPGPIDTARAAATIARPIVPWWYQKVEWNGQPAYRDMRKGQQNRPLIREKDIVGPDNPEGFVHVWPAEHDEAQSVAKPGLADRFGRAVARLFGRR